MHSDICVDEVMLRSGVQVLYLYFRDWVELEHRLTFVIV